MLFYKTDEILGILIHEDWIQQIQDRQHRHHHLRHRLLCDRQEDEDHEIVNEFDDDIDSLFGIGVHQKSGNKKNMKEEMILENLNVQRYSRDRTSFHFLPCATCQEYHKGTQYKLLLDDNDYLENPSGVSPHIIVRFVGDDDHEEDEDEQEQATSSK